MEAVAAYFRPILVVVALDRCIRALYILSSSIVRIFVADDDNVASSLGGGTDVFYADSAYCEPPTKPVVNHSSV